MTISDERIAELEHDLAVLPDTMGHRLDAAELRYFLQLARVRRCEAAECEAWRRRESDMPNMSFGQIQAAWNVVLNARAATDAARAAAQAPNPDPYAGLRPCGVGCSFHAADCKCGHCGGTGLISKNTGCKSCDGTGVSKDA